MLSRSIFPETIIRTKIRLDGTLPAVSSATAKSLCTTECRAWNYYFSGLFLEIAAGAVFGCGFECVVLTWSVNTAGYPQAPASPVAGMSSVPA